MCLGRPRFRNHLDHGHRQGLSLAWLRTRQGVTYQLRGQNGFESSSRVVCRTAKFVSPIGLRLAANGDTNCACLPFYAKSMRLSGTFVDPHGFLLSASPVQPTLMTAAKYVRTSVSSSGWSPRRKKSCWCPISRRKRWYLLQLRSRQELSLGQQPQQQANVRSNCLRKLNQPKALWNLVSKILFEEIDYVFVPQPEVT